MKESTEKIEEVEWDRSTTYQVIAGELRKMYSPYPGTFFFSPVAGRENEQCIAEWEVSLSLGLQ